MSTRIQLKDVRAQNVDKRANGVIIERFVIVYESAGFFFFFLGGEKRE